MLLQRQRHFPHQSGAPVDEPGVNLHQVRSGLQVAKGVGAAE